MRGLKEKNSWCQDREQGRKAMKLSRNSIDRSQQLPHDSQPVPERNTLHGTGSPQGASPQFRLSTGFRKRRHILIRGGVVMVSRVGGTLFGVRGSMAGLLSFTTQRATDSRSRQRPRQQDQDQRHRSCYLELHLPPLYLNQ